MRPLTKTMEDALLSFVAHDQNHDRAPIGVREGTIIALEDRGLIDTIVDPAARVSAFAPLLFRRTLAGENLAIEISLDREAVRG